MSQNILTDAKLNHITELSLMLYNLNIGLISCVRQIPKYLQKTIIMPCSNQMG